LIGIEDAAAANQQCIAFCSFKAANAVAIAIGACTEEKHAYPQGLCRNRHIPYFRAVKSTIGGSDQHCNNELDGTSLPSNSKRFPATSNQVSHPCDIAPGRLRLATSLHRPVANPL